MLQRLGIEPSEGRTFGWAVAALFVLGWAEISVTNVAETLFIKRVGVEHLPLAFLANSVLLVGSTAVAARLATGSDRLRLLPRVLVVLGLALLPLWALVLWEVKSAFLLLVFAAKQLPSIAFVVFWIAMGDLLNAQQAKRLFAPLTAGLTLGAVVGSFASDPIARIVGIDGLLPFATVAMGVAAALLVPLRRSRGPRLERGFAGRARSGAEPNSARPDAVPALRELWRESRLFRLLAATMLLGALLAPMLYYQFQYVADLATAGAQGEERLLALYAQLRGWLYLAILVAQLSLTARLYRRIGIPLAIVASPLIYLLGFLGLSVRLSLPTGVGALVGARLQDKSVYDPGTHILFNLFPEDLRSWATGLLEGPIKRMGGVLGNAATYAAVQAGGAGWVGFAALPAAVVWLGIALLLWRTYPELLLRSAFRRDRFGDASDVGELLDPGTVRALGVRLEDPDPARCRAAIALVSEARRDLAVGVLAEAVRKAPASTLRLLVPALDRLLEEAVSEPVHDPQAARALAERLAEPGQLGDRERADLVQAYGRLAGAEASRPEVLERALADSAPAVRLAAEAALHRQGGVAAGDDLDRDLEAALVGDDAAARRTAREELRALLLAPERDERWPARLAALAALLRRPSDRAAAAEALMDVAQRHGESAALAAPAMLALRDDPAPRVRAAVLRFVGRAGLRDHARWVVECAGSARPEEARAARDALCALGPSVADALLVGLSYGRRATRDAILPLVRDLRVDLETLRNLYLCEIDAIRRLLAQRIALGGGRTSPIVLQRLDERVGEALHTALLLLTAIHDEDRIAALAGSLKRASRGRRRAILVEALGSLLPAREKARVVPLLDERIPQLEGRVAAGLLGVPIPSAAEAKRAVLEDSDDLTRRLVAWVGWDGDEPGLARGADLEDHGGVLSPVEIALHLKSLPMFEGLTTRQLMDLAGEVREVSQPAHTTIFAEGDTDDCLYLIVEGAVEIKKGETLLTELGARDAFGEMSIFEGTARSATAASRTAVRMLCLQRDDLLRLMEELPAIAICICQVLSRRVRELSDRVHA